MTKDDIIRMAKEAGFEIHDITLNFPKELRCFAALVIEAEREACAMLCDELRQQANADNASDNYPPTAYHAGRATMAKGCADLIRARGE